MKSIIICLAFAAVAKSKLVTECTDDNQYHISLPYTTNNSQILSATAGTCSENSSEIIGRQDIDNGRFNVTIDIERCSLNTETYSHPKVTKKSLYMANVTNLKLGRRGNGIDFVYLDMDIKTECGVQMVYEISHEYGSISSTTLPPTTNDTDPSSPILPGAREKFHFRFKEYTDQHFNVTLNSTTRRQAGTKAFIAIEAQNMDPAEYTFNVPDCMVETSTGKKQALFSKLDEQNSFIDLRTDYQIIGTKQAFLLSHLYFVLDRSTSATYNLTCNVKVCKANHIGQTCSIMQSCSTSPCVHGTCTDTMTWRNGANATNYSCSCDSGYRGDNCDVIEACTQSPCIQGTCNDKLTWQPGASTTDYNCSCTSGYRGDVCQVADACSQNPCVHGTCVDKLTWQPGANVTDYNCTCDTGYTGVKCDEADNTCTANGDVFGYKLEYKSKHQIDHIEFTNNGVSTIPVMATAATGGCTVYKDGGSCNDGVKSVWDSSGIKDNSGCWEFNDIQIKCDHSITANKVWVHFWSDSNYHSKSGFSVWSLDKSGAEIAKVLDVGQRSGEDARHDLC